MSLGTASVEKGWLGVVFGGEIKWGAGCGGIRHCICLPYRLKFARLKGCTVKIMHTLDPRDINAFFPNI